MKRNVLARANRVADSTRGPYDCSGQAPDCGRNEGGSETDNRFLDPSADLEDEATDKAPRRVAQGLWLSNATSSAGRGPSRYPRKCNERTEHSGYSIAGSVAAQTAIGQPDVFLRCELSPMPDLCD